MAVLGGHEAVVDFLLSHQTVDVNVAEVRVLILPMYTPLNRTRLQINVLLQHQKI